VKAPTFRTRAISFGAISIRRWAASEPVEPGPRRLAGVVHAEYRLRRRLSDYEPNSPVSNERRDPGVSGEILLSNIRSLDASARPIRYAGAALPPQTAELVRIKLAALITI